MLSENIKQRRKTNYSKRHCHTTVSSAPRLRASCQRSEKGFKI